MTPTHARKRGIKYRYYISSALAQGQAEQAGAVKRIPADEIEALIVKTLRKHLGDVNNIDDRSLIDDHVTRVEVKLDKLIIELVTTKVSGPSRRGRPNAIEIPWRKTPFRRRREILIPESQQRQEVCPIRSENRATLVAAIARGRRWLDELIAEPALNAERIADREGCTTRQVNMTISLAFLAPDLVKAAIQGRLPHGMGVRRLRDMPSEWHRQRHTLGL